MARASTRLRPAVPKGDIPMRSRRAHNKISYVEQDTDVEDFHDSADDWDLTPMAAPSMTVSPAKSRSAMRKAVRTTTGSKRKPSGNEVAGHKVQAYHPKRKKMSQKPFSKKEPSLDGVREQMIQMTGKTMPWATLPYHVLTSIFFYASYPVMLSSETHDSSNVKWLARMARCTKAFTEPALTALYHQPPIQTRTQFQRLRSLLGDEEHRAIHYRSKIKYLDIEQVEEHHVAGALHSYTPLLRGYTLGLVSGDPKHAPTLGRPRPSRPFPLGSLEWLTTPNTRLQTYTWHRGLYNFWLNFSFMKRMHQSEPFRSLKELTFYDLCDVPTITYGDQDIRCEDAFADVLKPLLMLRHLRIILAPIVNDILTPALPAGLETLELISCLELRSKAMSEFLAAKGQTLRKLVLSHNQRMNLSFLTDLAQSCPRLEMLKIDLLYYNSHHTFHDSDPKFQKLFDDGERPSWPAWLQDLEILYLRKWTTDAARSFFASLSDAAGTLVNLRRINLKASLDESGWRDRVKFRDTWIPRLKRIFLRRSAPPNPHLQSFAKFKAWKASQRGTRSSPDRTASVALTGSVQAKETKINDGSSDSDAPLINIRRSTRSKCKRETFVSQSRNRVTDLTASRPASRQIQRRPRRRRGPDDSSSEDSALNDVNDDINNNDEQALSTLPRTRHHTTMTAATGAGSSPESENPLKIQGMCDTVEIVIDNLRPMEEQLRENDFLDEEVSGDEDWNGDDDMPGDGYAW